MYMYLNKLALPQKSAETTQITKEMDKFEVVLC
jgi:hypothetical protein